MWAYRDYVASLCINIVLQINYDCSNDFAMNILREPPATAPWWTFWSWIPLAQHHGQRTRPSAGLLPFLGLKAEKERHSNDSLILSMIYDGEGTDKHKCTTQLTHCQKCRLPPFPQYFFDCAGDFHFRFYNCWRLKRDVQQCSVSVMMTLRLNELCLLFSLI